MTYEYSRADSILTAMDEGDDKFGELQIADYFVFLFAFDTYLRWMKETGRPHGDPVFARGITLLRAVEQQHLDRIADFLRAGITSPGSIRMLENALRLPPTPAGASARALRLRTVLSRGGPTTAKHVFGTSTRARREVTDAIEDSMMEEAPAALSKFGIIVLKDKRLQQWIARASVAASSGGEAIPVESNPVHEAAKQVGESTHELVAAKVTQEAASPASTDHADAQVTQAAVLKEVETKATEAAAKSLAQAGQVDASPTRSEVVGIATAAATAVTSDPNDLKNIPPAFINGGRPLDPEQMDAARTNGKVLVAAGAGAGKSTTLVSRIAYLVDNLGTNPSRIMAVSFNKKAANELQEKIQKKIGAERGRSVMCDTMHTVFRKFIIGDPKSGVPAFGTREEQQMMTENLIAPPSKGRTPPRVKPADMSRAINTIWGQCAKEQLAAHTGWPAKLFENGPPKAKKAGLFINKWAGNDVSWQQAKASARTDKERLAALYYEFYLGLKGDIPNWRPPAGSKGFSAFMERYRRGGERLGDMDDMLKIFRDILRRDPKAKATIQGMYDHILIDEAQDSNTVQHQIFDALSEHIECKDPKKSIWLVGDDRQAIYQFRGAKPELFQQHWDDGCWTGKMIRTNYRCPPEVVEVANRLVSHNPERLPVDAIPSKYKTRGEASVKMEVLSDNAEAAIETLRDIRKDLAFDPQKYRPEDYAVLSRTNAELNNFETACIINEIPYVRRGGHGFLDAPESKAVIGYIDLASGTDFEKKQKSLINAMMKPDRGLFLGPDKVEAAVKDAIDDVARYERKDEKSVDPNILLTDRTYARKFAEYLKMPYKNQLTAKGPWLWNKIVDQLTNQILDMGRDVNDIRKITSDPEATTKDLLAFVLDNVKGTTTNWDPGLRREVTTVQSLRENISNHLKLSDDDDDEEEDTEVKPQEIDEEGRPVVPKVENPAKGLGAVQFLFELSEPNQNDHDLGNLPDKASGFTKKIERFSKIADGLRMDPRKWEEEQAKITDPKLRQEKMPAVTLTTVHSVKGLEWPHCTVLMPKGVFPIELRTKPGEEPPTPEDAREHDISERNLAYVALTRAAKNLTVIAIPDPKTGALSRYIADAGLHPGENVPKPEGTPPSSPVAPDVKTAAVPSDEGAWHYAQWVLDAPSYDRRPS